MNTEDNSKYFVAWRDETIQLGGAASSPIPSIGAATKALDQYRILGIETTNLADLGVAFTDVRAVASLSKIAEGGIQSSGELEAAETALQAILLHDVVHVLTFAPKVDLGNGVITYLRRDHGLRTKFGFDLLGLAGSKDWIIAPEFLTAQDGTIVGSTLPGSRLLHRPVESLMSGEIPWNAAAVDAINVAIESHGIPAYLTEPEMVRSRRGDGFAKRFYTRLREPWDKAVADVPPIVCSFSLPPLLAIVLDRLNNREDLRNTIAGLREELSPVRRELHLFDAIPIQSTSASEMESRVRHITQSFDAIFPESRLSVGQRRRRLILALQRIVRPLVSFSAGFFMSTGPSFEDTLQAVNGIESAVLQSNALVNRTVTAQTFTNIVNTEPVQNLVKFHFDGSEVAAIERSLRRD